MLIRADQVKEHVRFEAAALDMNERYWHRGIGATWAHFERRSCPVARARKEILAVTRGGGQEDKEHGLAVELCGFHLLGEEGWARAT
jgi:hypothetical protein